MYKSTNPKIDIYVKGVYVGSTNWFKTCKEAKASYCWSFIAVDPLTIKCKKAK